MIMPIEHYLLMPVVLKTAQYNVLLVSGFYYVIIYMAFGAIKSNNTYLQIYEIQSD